MAVGYPLRRFQRNGWHSVSQTNDEGQRKRGKAEAVQGVGLSLTVNVLGVRHDVCGERGMTMSNFPPP